MFGERKHVCPVREPAARVRTSLQRGKLHGEISDRRALGNASANFKTRGLGGQPIEKLVEAAAANDGEALQLPPGKLFEMAENFRIAPGEAVKDEAGKLGHGGRMLLDGSRTSSRKLPVD